MARRSGVSPAAPAHHFGDAAGLLTAVATLAFDGLTAALEAGNARGRDDPVARMREQGVGYVGFALRYPGRFGLMFRPDIAKDEALEARALATFAVLESGVRDLYGVPAATPLGPVQWNALLSLWSIVHGFAHLALAGKFDLFAPGGGRDALLRQTLAPMLRPASGGAETVRASRPDGAQARRDSTRVGRVRPNRHRVSSPPSSSDPHPQWPSTSTR